VVYVTDARLVTSGAVCAVSLKTTGVVRLASLSTGAMRSVTLSRDAYEAPAAALVLLRASDTAPGGGARGARALGTALPGGGRRLRRGGCRAVVHAECGRG